MSRSLSPDDFRGSWCFLKAGFQSCCLRPQNRTGMGSIHFSCCTVATTFCAGTMMRIGSTPRRSRASAAATSTVSFGLGAAPTARSTIGGHRLLSTDQTRMGSMPMCCTNTIASLPLNSPPKATGCHKGCSRAALSRTSRKPFLNRRMPAIGSSGMGITARLVSGLVSQQPNVCHHIHIEVRLHDQQPADRHRHGQPECRF